MERHGSALPETATSTSTSTSTKWVLASPSLFHLQLCHSCRHHIVGSDNGEAVQPLRVGAGQRKAVIVRDCAPASPPLRLMRQNESTADLVIGQTEQTFDSVPPPELPPSIRLSEFLDNLNMTKGMTQLSCASCWTPPRECLRVNVLGTSVANGCGGAEPPHSTRCADRKVDMTARCDVKMSWVRHMHDALRAWATGSGTHPTTTLHARNGASSLRTPLLRAA